MLVHVSESRPLFSTYSAEEMLMPKAEWRKENYLGDPVVVFADDALQGGTPPRVRVQITSEGDARINGSECRSVTV
jgi:hypothetical protein